MGSLFSKRSICQLILGTKKFSNPGERKVLESDDMSAHRIEMFVARRRRPELFRYLHDGASSSFRVTKTL